MVTRARVAVAECNGKGKLAVMLWYQGEADAFRLEDAELFQGRMEALVRDIRHDLRQPDLLVIQVLIATAQRHGKFIDRGKPRRQSAAGSKTWSTSIPCGCPLRAITCI